MRNKVIFSAIIALCVVCGLAGCDKNPIDPYELVTGTVTNEDGQALKGIQVSKFLDKELKDLVDYAITLEDGSYFMKDAYRYVEDEGMDTILIYLVAEDLREVYERQVVEAKLIYTPSLSMGSAKADIVMKKK